MPTTNTHYTSTTGLKPIGFLLLFSDPCTTSTNLSQQALKVSAPCTVTHDTHPLQRSSPTKTRRPVIFVCSIFFVLFHRTHIQSMTFL
jgi:oxalate decarboxylase/phosphoglucose isomerase-like protein (cupin superfamily)